MEACPRMFSLSWWDLGKQPKAWQSLGNQEPWPPSPAEGPGWRGSDVRPRSLHPSQPEDSHLRHFPTGKQGLQTAAWVSEKPAGMRAFAQKARDRVGHKKKGGRNAPVKCWKL